MAEELAILHLVIMQQLAEDFVIAYFLIQLIQLLVEDVLILHLALLVLLVEEDVIVHVALMQPLVEEDLIVHVQ